jgi:hypothetical protein
MKREIYKQYDRRTKLFVHVIEDTILNYLF